MDGMVRHQKHIPRLEEIGHALHYIGDLAAQEQDQLIKFMVVIVQFLGPAVLEMEKPEVLPEIPALAHFAAVQHGGAPSLRRFSWLPYLNAI
ncbi:hypothetical protein [Oscillibacter sp. CAG:155]|uniref:hypothetical protein n=1 Tax=Oscillibacter sp. CAG:155 TaxID=1262910 RepID=UPI00263F8B97|nr:hypothetical protein [Oscillibacter sp. CAG:155]